ncbi:TetR-like C-terminal domain-containing protein [Streptomyces griseocarneus]|uniref:TetR-like C-terminal domain-containing protein n=1 Tax=Streptomyces griseocarneus TaxID=51201 RepID=UPI00167D314F|nr:TetR-like C-terminal domain-containing protein [Streptomyces griseocarneus]MBZ6474976.1 WHG domain-containing protein [Streptomyces griseocarneus]GHG49221.1 TetR family transcriptional regulator [Streptomyces griseocarneus]
MTQRNLRADGADGQDALVRRAKEEAVLRLAGRRNVDLDLGAVAGASGIELARLREHFPDEEALLTALILDAYNAMSDSAEAGAARAAAAGAGLLERWVAVCAGVRDWALAHPDEYALIWGQPVPGYSAPPETMAAGARTVLALIAILRDAQKEGRLTEHADGAPLSEGMLRNAESLAAGLLEGLPHSTIARMLVIWTQLHGMVGFEVYGHIAGVAADPAAFFEHAAASMGEFVGLPR